MKIEEALKDGALIALQVDPDKIICLVFTAEEGTVVSQEFADQVHNTIQMSLVFTKFNGVPIFVLPHGAKLEAVVIPKQEGDVKENTPIFRTIQISCHHEIGWADQAQRIGMCFHEHLERTRLWDLEDTSPQPWEVHIHQMDNGWSIGLRTGNIHAPQLASVEGNTYFDVNIIGKTFFLLNMGLEKRLRGKGYGTELYETLEKIAKALGCERIEQTPSGGYMKLVGVERKKTVETRAEWLQRRGWILEHNQKDLPVVAYKDL